MANLTLTLTEDERYLLAEAVGRLTLDKGAVVHGRSRMPDAGVNEAAEEARLLLALKARLEVLAEGGAA